MRKLLVGIVGIVLSTGFGIGAGLTMFPSNFETEKLEPKDNYYVEIYKDNSPTTKTYFIQGM